jgi:5-methylcytosine-specific restriction endonuclease McrA
MGRQGPAQELGCRLATMGKRERRWAREARQRLIQDMGGVCWACGSEWLLQFDHIREDGGHKVRRWAGMAFRMVMFRKDWKAKKIQLLCESCHRDKPRNKRYNPPAHVVMGKLSPVVETPF